MDSAYLAGSTRSKCQLSYLQPATSLFNVVPTPNLPPLTERLPIELLERIFLFASVRDILRLSSVNRACRSLVQGSPWIQYEIDLFAAGLENNPQTEAPLSERRTALAGYCKKWETLDPAEKRDQLLHAPKICGSVTVSGTHGILRSDSVGSSVKFSTLGSVPRGIPRREWDLSFKDLGARSFTFYPQADILAIFEEVAWTWRIHLSTVKDGGPHPAAQIPVLSYDFGPRGNVFLNILGMSITGTRLAVLRGVSHPGWARAVVWDWTTGQILLELKNELYRSAKFVDDYWLAFALASCQPTAPPQLVLLNTEQTTTGGVLPTQTTFGFDPYERLDLGKVYLHLELGGHKPSHEERLLAPFYPDASQRLLVAVFPEHGSALVMKTEALLRLAQERGGTALEWEQWNAHVIEVLPGNIEALCVSGPRLFCIVPDSEVDGVWVWVYDFSARASVMSLDRVTYEGGRVQQVMQTKEKRPLPWDAFAVYAMTAGHDSIALLMELEADGYPFSATYKGEY